MRVVELKLVRLEARVMLPNAEAQLSTAEAVLPAVEVELITAWVQAGQVVQVPAICHLHLVLPDHHLQGPSLKGHQP